MKIIRILLGAGLFLFSIVAAQSQDLDPGSVDITVVKGDTLNGICRAYLLDIEVWPEIARINRLKNPDLIFPGDKIRIPIEYVGGFEDDGVVTFVGGEAFHKPKKNSEWAPLKVQDVVHSGDDLKTGPDGRVEISFASGNALEIRPEAQLKVLVTKKIDEMNVFHRILLGVGKVVARVKNITGRSNRFEVKTPSAVAAARGTEFRVGLDAEATTRMETLEGIIGVEAQAVLQEVKEGEGTLVRKDEPPQKPRPLPRPPAALDPLTGDLESPLFVRLSKIDEAVGYRVFIARDTAGLDVVAETAGPPDQPAEFPGPIADGDYYLIARSVDSLGLESRNAEPKPIRIRKAVDVLAPVSPVDGAIIAGASISVVWPALARTGRYHLQIAADADFKTLAADRTDLAADVFLTPPLQPGTYWLRSRAVTADGQEGPFCPPLKFQLIALPEAPILSEPKIKGKAVAFTCKNLGPGVVYRFQMANDERFRSIIEEFLSPKPEMTFTKPSAPGIYYARVAAVSPSGNEGPFSAIQTFRIVRGGLFRYICLIPAIILLIVLLA